MCFLAIYMSSSKKCLFRSPSHFLFFYMSYLSYLYILLCKKSISLIRCHLLIFVIFSTLRVGSKKILLRFMPKSVLPVFSSMSCIVYSLTFRSLIHFVWFVEFSRIPHLVMDLCRAFKIIIITDYFTSSDHSAQIVCLLLMILAVCMFLETYKFLLGFQFVGINCSLHYLMIFWYFWSINCYVSSCTVFAYLSYLTFLLGKPD